ncbi:hypothetical protein KI387_007930, partial [Taxus chinensis]
EHQVAAVVIEDKVKGKDMSRLKSIEENEVICDKEQVFKKKTLQAIQKHEDNDTNQ